MVFGRIKNLNIREGHVDQFVWVCRYQRAHKTQEFMVTSLKNLWDQQKIQEKAVHLRTIQKWVKHIREVSLDIPQEKLRDIESVKWYQLDQKDFSWHVSGVWADWQDKYDYDPSRSLLKWHWRLSQLGGWDNGCLLECAQKYEEREIKEIYKVPSKYIESMSDLEEEMKKLRKLSQENL